MVELGSNENVIDLRSYVDPTRVPTLVFVDLQEEYIAAPRRLAVPGAAQALDKCRVALAHARAIGLPIAFTRWMGRAPFFNRATRFSSWIKGFEPFGTEMVFERDRPSCYASVRFAEMMDMTGGGNIVLTGFAGETACLATVIDAYHRGQQTTFLSDASASHSIDDISSSDLHRIVSKLMRMYGTVITTEDWVRATEVNESMGGERRWVR